MVLQRKTQRPVQFELTEQTHESGSAWIAMARLALFRPTSRRGSTQGLVTAGGEFYWAGLRGVRNAYHAPNEGDLNLSAKRRTYGGFGFFSAT